jgi:hypothetical protein
MTGTVGFNTEAVAELAASLVAAADTASSIRQRHLQIAGRAADAAASVGYSSGPAGDPDGGALAMVTQQAPPLSGQVRQRLANLLALQVAGLSMDSLLAFGVIPPPSPQTVKAAIAFFNKHIDDSGGFLWSDPAKGAQEVLANWEKLTPAELDAVLSSLNSAQLKQLNKQLGEGSSWWGAGGPDRSVQQRFEQMILRAAGPSTLTKIVPLLTSLQFEPPLMNGTTGVTWQPFTGSLFGPDGTIDVPSQLAQGGDGDCWFLSSLAAVASNDPSFIKSHIWENPNGTYTVVLYQNGKPVDVTVSADLPYQDGVLIYAQTPDGADWVALYEKALAQLTGGYQNINGNYGNVGLAYITGGHTSQFGWDSSSPPSLASIHKQLAQGDEVLAATRDDSITPNAWQEQGTNDELVADHEYRVVSVTTDTQSGQLMITVANPWGPSPPSPAPQYVTLTEQEFQRDFGELSTAPNLNAQGDGR